jgi:nucleoid DNA-binding protein
MVAIAFEASNILEMQVKAAIISKMTAAWWLDGVLEEMDQAFRSGYGLTLPGFGGLYLDHRRESWAFKFNPGQKLRALFGWSSTYRGPL